MASNKTPNLGLDIWQPDDFFKRAEVNNNFTKIDAKAKENSDKIGDLSKDVNNNANKVYESVKRIDAPYDYGGPIFTIIDDDGTKNMKTILKPVLDARGLKATLAIVTNQVGTTDRLTKEELLQLQGEGFEIVSHSTNHANIYNNDTKTIKEVEDSLRDSQNWLIQNGFKGYDTFVLPYGDVTSRNKKIARKYYKNCIRSTGGAINSFPYDNAAIPRQGIRITDDFTTVLKPIIDSCIANNGWLVFLTHSGYEITQELMNTVLDYISAYPVVTFSEGLKYKGNALSIGDFGGANQFFVSSGGLVKGGGLTGNTVVGSPISNGSNIDSVIASNYQDNKLTIQNVDYRAVSPSSLALSQGGVLLTWKSTEDYLHQFFIAQSRSYIRRWDRGNQKWNSWTELLTPSSLALTSSQFQIIENALVNSTSSRKITDSMGTYTSNKMTITKVTAGYGVENKGGILETFNLGDYYSYQRFIATDGQLYMRYWSGTLASGSFTVWKKVTTTDVVG